MKNVICTFFIFSSDHHTADLASQSIRIQPRIIAYISSNIAAFGNNRNIKLLCYIIRAVQ